MNASDKTQPAVSLRELDERLDLLTKRKNLIPERVIGAWAMKHMPEIRTALAHAATTPADAGGVDGEDARDAVAVLGALLALKEHEHRLTDQQWNALELVLTTFVPHTALTPATEAKATTKDAP